MATQPLMTEQQILADLQAYQAQTGTLPTGQQAPPPPKLNINGVEVDVTDTAALQRELDKLQGGSAGQIAALQSQLATLTAAQQAAAGVTQTPPAPTPKARKKPNKDEFAEQFLENPGVALSNTLAAQLGLPEGVEFGQVVTGLMNYSQQMKAELDELKKTVGTADTNRVKDKIEMETQQFLSSNAAYEPNKANSEILGGILQEYGLGFTKKNLELAFREATQRQLIQPRATGQQGQHFAPLLGQWGQQPQPQQHFIPSLRGGNANFGNDQDFSTIQAQLDKMKPSDVKAYIDSVKGRLGQP